MFLKLIRLHPVIFVPLAKQRGLSFTSNNHVAHSPFDLVHCDISGPYHVVSYTGHNYFLTLVDDCTRFTWVYLLKQKSDAAVVIPRFYNMVAKEFRADNAKELAFTEFFHEKGALHQFSCVERLEQNSVVERKHQHLLNVARALFFHSRVPLPFWTDCILTATCLINRTPVPLLYNQTPFELLYHKSVDYSLLQVFGCLAFSSTLVAHRTKF